MKKKLLILAVLATSTPVLSLAETANVNVYGTLNISAENVNATQGSTATPALINRNRVQSNSSNFGVKGTEDLGNDLKGIFQVETGFDSMMNKTGGTVSLRNTAVGLSGGFGQVLFGLWDTPYKTATMFMEPFYGTSSATLSNLLDSTGSNTTGVTTYGSGGGSPYSFHRRQGNSIQYWSPNFAGIQAKIMYSANVDREVVMGTNPDLWSASVAYDANGMNAAIVYEIHNDFHGTATTPSTKDTALKAAIGYKLGDTQVGVALSTMTAKTNSAAGESSSSRPAYGASVIHHLGDLAIRGAFTMASTGSSKSNGVDTTPTDLGAMNGMIGVSYSFSKRTDFYADYSKLWNQASVSYNYMYNPITANLAAGADPQTVALGIRHSF